MASPPFEIRYDRRVTGEFLAHFLAGGVADRLRVIAERAALPLDLQMRKDPRTKAQRATLYAGLTAVLNMYETRQGLRFDAHRTWSEERRYGFSPAWRTGLSHDDVAQAWPDVELYLERVIPPAVRSHGMTEGAVQSVVSKSVRGDWAMLDREVLPAYRDQKYKQQRLRECNAQLLDEPWTDLMTGVPKPPQRLGTECDLLAVDDTGRLLAIEVKPLAGTIAWVPAQAAMYALLLQQWVDIDRATAQDGVTPRSVAEGMLAQRQALGHAGDFSVTIPDDLKVAPVVVLQKGATAARKDQMMRVRDEVTKRTTGRIPPVEIYEVSILGDFHPLT